ncbi:phage tail protein [Acinetobacter puyangensis]|uniref:pyocin knob domain-containing protein n=1 Tax=Acinetobacter puyangensis TaxID=1096779 RepID=UPI003A4DD147
MTKQTIGIGSAGNDGNGDPARTAFTKTNANFTEVYTALGGGTGTIPAALPIANGGTGATTAAAARTNLGLGTTATATVTTSTIDTTAGRILKVGDFGIGANTQVATSSIDLNDVNLPVGFYSGNNWANAPVGSGSTVWGYLIVQNLASGGSALYALQMFTLGSNTAGNMWYRLRINGTWQSWRKIYSENNTTTDANGFIKSASPVVQLFADKIELNDEAKQQDITFEKVGTGDYLIKGSSGFAESGWYIETPKDANGNVLFSVIYEQLENGDISVKTYKKKFDIETASIVADLSNPINITDKRWIDVRLQELPQEEPAIIDEVPDDTIE